MDFIPDFLIEIETLDHEELLYRGHADRDKFELKPSIGRHYTGDWHNVLKWEDKSLTTFKQRAIPFIKSTPKSDIEWLALMQHHGCSTRLLDFTKNPLVALFFASDPNHNTDGEVITAKYKENNNQMINENLFKTKGNFVYHPPHITERIIGQEGCFVYSSKPNTPLKEKDIKRKKIKKEDKKLIRQELKTIGISFSSLFPSIDGICQDLNDNLLLELIEDNLLLKQRDM